MDKAIKWIIAILTVLTVQVGQAQKVASDFNVEYYCKSQKAVQFRSGDRDLQTGLVSEVAWVPAPNRNLNLVIGDHEVILWVRQPYNTHDRLITVLRKVPGRGMKPDKEEIDMGKLSDNVTRVISLEIPHDTYGKNLIECSIRFY